jgi:SAM-dependent methyltransferase
LSEPRSSRWTSDPGVPRGAAYDARFERLAASGAHVHGEADLIADLAPGPRILDAGCGTGRVAIELDRRGLAVTGTDLDPAMLEAARTKAPHLPWLEADLTELDLGTTFDLVALAGNVLIFVAPGTEATTVARCAAHLEPGGLLVAGFSIRAGGYEPDLLDAHAADAGLGLVERWASWDRLPYEGGDYQVSVHRLDH